MVRIPETRLRALADNLIPETLLAKVETLTAALPAIHAANLKLIDTPVLTPLAHLASSSSGSEDSKPWSDRQGYLKWATETLSSKGASSSVSDLVAVNQSVGSEEDARVRLLLCVVHWELRS